MVAKPARPCHPFRPLPTITPTALVKEAWLKLAGTSAVAQTSPLHFKRIAARAMRQVLVEAARRRTARKRGGPDAVNTCSRAAYPAIAPSPPVPKIVAPRA